MTEPIITMLNPTNISNAWPEIEPMMAGVLVLSGTHKTSDVHKRLLSGQAQIWVQWNDGIDAFLVTEFMPFPEVMLLNIWLMAAKENKEVLWGTLKKEINRFASANLCPIIRVEGRDGFLKAFPEAKKQAVVMVYPVSKEMH